MAKAAISNRTNAVKAKVHHRFVRGIGYIKYASHPKLYARVAGREQNCTPPIGTKDNTAHFLKIPGGGSTMVFTWIAKEQAWERLGGLRMAFTAEYLAHHGWMYAGPCLR